MALRRRYFPSWLPATASERQGLLRIRRHQIGVIVFLAALAPVGWVMIWLTGSDTFLVPLTLLWLTIGVTLAQRVAMGRCPRCGERFCQKPDLPFWFGLLARNCDHCGLGLDTPFDDVPH